MSETYNSIIKDANNEKFQIPSIFFSNSIKNVIYTMTGLEVTEVKVYEEEEKGNAPQISSAILLVGIKNVMISITVSNSVARTIVSFMTGIHGDKLKEEELYDGIIELANMVAGEIKAQVSGKGYNFKTLSPFAIVGGRHTLIHKNKVVNISKKFRAGNSDIYLNAYFL